MQQVVATSGAKYSDGYTIAWNKGKTLMIEAGTLKLEDCAEIAVATSMSGLFTYTADAATFVDCTSGKRYRVEMKQGFQWLQEVQDTVKSCMSSPSWLEKHFCGSKFECSNWRAHFQSRWRLLLSRR